MDKNKKQILILGGVALAAAILVGVLYFTGSGKLGSSGGTVSGGTSTALGTLSAAESALTTTAPDAKLLMVQTLTSVPTTGTPQWAYLFGSPSSDKGYVVYASDGKVMTTMEYGAMGFSADEWKNVPDIGSWKIDSDKAYSKALAVSGAKGTPAAYFMGLITYKSTEDTSSVQPFEWNVWFDSGSSGATSNRITVDAKSGKATVTNSQ